MTKRLSGTATDGNSSEVGAASSSQSLVDSLADEIRVGIMTGRLPIGMYLRQETLATEFGVSRTPIREALRQLAPEGLVQVVPNRGVLVRGPTAREIREAYLVRAELEGFAAELATEWIREDELARLQEAEDVFRQLVDGTGPLGSGGVDAEIWVKANDTFHDVIQEAARNAALRRTILALHRSIPRNLTGNALSGDARLLKRNAAEHARIVKAIADQDAPEARRAMTEHVCKSGEIVATWFELRAAKQADRP